VKRSLLALAAAARRRWSSRPLARDLEVQSRAWLARDTGVALVRVRGESLLVGWGRDGVRLLSRLGREDTP
jgi:flagellar biogenesis protein FliO